MSFHKVQFYVYAGRNPPQELPDAYIFVDLLRENMEYSVDDDTMSRAIAFLGVVEDTYRAGRTHTFLKPCNGLYCYVADFFIPVEAISSEEIREMRSVIAPGFYPCQGFDLEGTTSSF